MKRILKKIARLFIDLTEKPESAIRQSVLVVDGSFILPNNLSLIISDVKKRFLNAKITVLTFYDKESFVKEKFPEIEVIIPSSWLRNMRHQLAVQLFILLKQRYNFIILSSLNVTLLFLSMSFGKSQVFLHNRWLQWYKIRARTVGDVFRGAKSADTNRRRNNHGIKDIIKSLGRIFVLLLEVKNDDFTTRILLQDNGYTETNHLLNAVRSISRLFINPDITMVTFEGRSMRLLSEFPSTHIVTVARNKRFGLAMKMGKMRKPEYDVIVVTALDVSPILISWVVLHKKVSLYNRWLQWWSLDAKNIFGYIKSILLFILMIPAFIFLFIFASFILLRTNLRLAMMKAKTLIRQDDGP